MPTSAGCLVTREYDGWEEVLLVRVYDLWQVPKGLVEKVEELSVAAGREVTEETGLTVEVGDYIASVKYGRPKKTVHAFEAQLVGGEVDSEGKAVDIQWEIHAARFMPWDEAHRLIIKSQLPLIEAAMKKRNLPCPART